MASFQIRRLKLTETTTIHLAPVLERPGTSTHLGLGRLMGTKRERRPPLPSAPWAGPTPSKRRAASFPSTNATVWEEERGHTGQRNEETFLLG